MNLIHYRNIHNFCFKANKIMDNFLLKGGLEKRAVLYWETAIHLLERINQYGGEHKSKNSLFEFYRQVVLLYFSYNVMC